MRVHEVMRCGHVQEWPPGQRVHDRLGMPWELWVCSLTWLVSETPSSVTENRILTCCEPEARGQSQLSGQSQRWLLLSLDVVLFWVLAQRATHFV